MKKISKLNQVVIGFGGEPVVGFDGVTINVRNVLLQYLAGYVSPTKESVFLAIKVGTKIFESKEDSIELEDSDFAFVEEAMKKPQHSAIIMRSLYEALKQEEDGTV